MRTLRVLVLLLAVITVAAACGSDNKKSSSESTTSSTAGEVPKGGTLVVGAEQEPDCLDVLATCSSASWGHWIAHYTTLPRPFDIKETNGAWDYVVNKDLLTGEPKVETSPKLKITFDINPKAVWSDGQPITSTDFKYVWEQVKTGTGIYDTTGFTDIESVDDSDPHTAVITFSKPYAPWRALYVGNYGLLPSHILQGKDRTAEMTNGYTWSGGPWKIESWQKGVSLTLIPNDKFWGHKPNLDKVVFKFITDTSAEFQAIKAGETMAGYPQPQPDAIDQLKAGISGLNSNVTDQTSNSEAIWMNNQKFPFDDVKVRQAFAYSLDRDAIVARLFGGIGVTKAQNSFNPAVMKKFVDETQFAKYKLDLDKASSLMTDAGFKKGSDGVWAKNGQRAVLEMKATAGNKRRELTEQILQPVLKEAGFELKINNQKAGDLFGDQLPKGDFNIALYAQVLNAADPSLCNLFCSKNIPTTENKFTGNNYTRTNVSELDTLLGQVDSVAEDGPRIEASKKAEKVLADNLVSLPFDPLPNIVLWSKKVVGPVGQNPFFGPFWNLDQWGLKQ